MQNVLSPPDIEILFFAAQKHIKLAKIHYLLLFEIHISFRCEDIQNFSFLKFSALSYKIIQNMAQKRQISNFCDYPS